MHWRNDFDWTGLRITTAAVYRLGARPCRMTAADYADALAQGNSEPLRGPPACSPWDPELAAAMVAEGRSVMEERLVRLLLEDLGSSSSCPARWLGVDAASVDHRVSGQS